MTPVDAPYRLLAEHADFLVIHKYPGLAVHKDTGQAGLVMQLQADRGEPLHLVHRLDKVTSGLLLLARNAPAAAALGQLFQMRQIQKYYLALGGANAVKKQGLIKGDMEKSRRGSWRLTRRCDNPAVTRFFSQGIVPGLRLYLLKPLTGKTHQLRVALKSLGVPILGDRLYGGAPADRVYLHAWQLHFYYQNQSYRFCAPPQTGEWFNHPDVQAQLVQWQHPDQLPWPEKPEKTQ